MAIDDWLYVALLIGAPVVFVAAVILAAHRFARRRQREGEWTADGPVHPTQPEGDWGLVPGYGAHRPQIESEPEDPQDDSH